MIKLTFILTLLFLFSSSSYADDDAIDLDLPTNPTLLLPSQHPKRTTTVGFAEIFPENTDGPKPTETHDRPMRIVRLHPINRHFPVAGHLGSLRMPHHRCRHGKPIPRISFDDEMMVVSGENGDFDPMVHVEVPEQWVRIHRHHRLRHHHHRHDGLPKFPVGKHHDFFSNHRFGEERVEERDGEREERPDGSFMRSIRKFLNGRF